MPRSLALWPALCAALCLHAMAPAEAQDAEAQTPLYSSGPYAGCGMEDGFWSVAAEELAVLYPEGAPPGSLPQPSATLPEGLVLHCTCIADIDGDGEGETIGLAGTPLEGDFPITEHVRVLILDDYEPVPRVLTEPLTSGDFEEAYAGAHLFAADVDGDDAPEVLLRGWTAGASARPTTLTVFEFRAEGDGAPALESIGSAYGEMDVTIGDYNGDGVPEFTGASSIGWEIPHVCAPRWATIWSVRDGALSDVSADFPENAGAPLEEFEALFTTEDLESDPRKDCEIRYYMGLRYELDGDTKKAAEWYDLAIEAYAAAVEEWRRLIPDEEPTFLLERQRAAEARLEELEG